MRRGPQRQPSQRIVKNLNSAHAAGNVPSCANGEAVCVCLISESSVFNSILELIETIAWCKCPVIITGDTGVGKDLVARQTHYASDRAGKVFVPVDCTTLTGQLFESQLFGHTRGAFTGAVDRTLGFFRAANGGTIILDEIQRHSACARLLFQLAQGLN